MNSQSTTRNTFLTLISLSQIGYAWWFFGNLYEALVKVPELLANSARLQSVLSVGSPVLYYIPGFVLVVGTTAAAVVIGWRARIERRALAWMAAFISIGILATAYLVPTVNLKLFVAGPSIDPLHKAQLLQLWYRVNYVRLAATACGWWFASQINRRAASQAYLR